MEIIDFSKLELKNQNINLFEVRNEIVGNEDLLDKIILIPNQNDIFDEKICLKLFKLEISENLRCFLDVLKNVNDETTIDSDAYIFGVIFFNKELNDIMVLPLDEYIQYKIESENKKIMESIESIYNEKIFKMYTIL